MSLKNKVALVTGASSGIGAATAILFTKEGADVVIVGRNETKLKNVEETCEEKGNKPLIIKADVAKDDEARAIVKKTIDKFGKLDILVNNAGIVKEDSILDENFMNAYDEVMNINLRALVFITNLAAPYLIKTKGCIVNISSIAALSASALPNYLAYSVSKAGIDHFTRIIALELASSGVRVNSVNPGPVVTDIFNNAGISEDLTYFEKFKTRTALGRLGEADEIADLIMFLVSDKAKSITGSTFVSDNGLLLKHT